MNDEIKKTPNETPLKKTAGEKLIYLYLLVTLSVVVITVIFTFLSSQEDKYQTKMEDFANDLYSNFFQHVIPIILLISTLSFLQGIFYYISGVFKRNSETRKNGKSLLFFSFILFVLIKSLWVFLMVNATVIGPTSGEFLDESLIPTIPTRELY